MARPKNIVMVTGARSRRVVGQTRQHVDVSRLEFNCPSGKQQHEEYADALTSAENMMDAGRVDPGCHQTPYVCPDCKRWHIYNRVITFRD